jgi:C4-dicarboxylate transporter
MRQPHLVVLVVAAARVAARLTATTLVILAVLIAVAGVAGATAPVALARRSIVRVANSFRRDALLELFQLQVNHLIPS